MPRRRWRGKSRTDLPTTPPPERDVTASRASRRAHRMPSTTCSRISSVWWLARPNRMIWAGLRFRPRERAFELRPLMFVATFSSFAYDGGADPEAAFWRFPGRPGRIQPAADSGFVATSPLWRLRPFVRDDTGRLSGIFLPGRVCCAAQECPSTRGMTSSAIDVAMLHRASSPTISAVTIDGIALVHQPFHDRRRGVGGNSGADGFLPLLPPAIRMSRSALERPTGWGQRFRRVYRRFMNAFRRRRYHTRALASRGGAARAPPAPRNSVSA